MRYNSHAQYGIIRGSLHPLELELVAAQSALDEIAPVRGRIVIPALDDARRGLRMEAPGRPVDAVLLDEADHVRREGVGILLPRVVDERHLVLRRGADLAEEDRMLRRDREDTRPAVVPVVGVPLVNTRLILVEPLLAMRQPSS